MLGAGVGWGDHVSGDQDRGSRRLNARFTRRPGDSPGQMAGPRWKTKGTYRYWFEGVGGVETSFRSCGRAV